MQLEAAALLFLFIYTQWWAVRAARMAEESDSTKREYLYTREKKKWQTTCVGNDVAIFYDYDKFSCVFLLHFFPLLLFVFVSGIHLFFVYHDHLLSYFVSLLHSDCDRIIRNLPEIFLSFFFSGENQLKYWGDLDGVIRVLK